MSTPVIIGNASLYSGDCLDVMPSIADESVDMILADLPYGTTNCAWDIVIPLEPLWEQYKRIVKPNGAIVLFAQTPFDKVLGCSNLPMLKYEWIWEKTQATGHFNAKKAPMKAHENILVFYKKQPTYNPQKTQGHAPVNSYTKRKEVVNKTQVYGKVNIDISGGGNTDRYPRTVQTFSSDKQTSYYHPTQKPVALGEYFIRTYTHEGMTVLDNTMGSGTFGVSAVNTNRPFIGIEKPCEKGGTKHFETACMRIREATKQVRLFA